MKLIGLTLLVIIALCIFVATALSAIFIWIGSKFAGISNATFGRAFYAALLSSVAVWALTGLASAFFGIGSLAGWLLGIIVTLGILKSIYEAEWGSAILIWIFTGVAHVIVGIVMVILVITGFLALAL
jgi:hypothetical protein